jgi:hypothetical protein
MESNAIVSNATLYSLLEAVYKLLEMAWSLVNTIHVNQTQIIIPAGSMNAKNLAALQIDVDLKFAALDAKLDQILLQVTPPETGDSNVETAKIS